MTSRPGERAVPPRARRFATLALAALAGCASASLIKSDDVARIERDLTGARYYLRSSLFVMPFFHDESRRLASPYHPDSIELLLSPTGEVISPGDEEGLLPIGSQVRIDKVEMPTSLVVTRRPLYSPRDVPWVYFSLMGQRGGAPYVAVMRQGIRTKEEFYGAFDRLFSKESTERWLEQYPRHVRDAIKEKRLLVGMDAQAVEHSWGKPERARSSLEDGILVMEWFWPLGHRSALFREERLVSATPPIE